MWSVVYCQGAIYMCSHMAPVVCTCMCHMAWVNSPCKVCTLQKCSVALEWASSPYLVIVGNKILLENGCAACVRFGWRLAALVCGLEHPAAWLLSAVDASTQPHRLVAPAAAWNIHSNQLHQYKGASCCVLAFWSYWIDLGHSVWLTGAQ